MSSEGSRRAAAIRRMTWIIRGGLITAATGAVWTLWPVQVADAGYRPAVMRPAFGSGRSPHVLVDDSHYNFHTSSGGYRPFAQLLVRDGFRVTGSRGRVNDELLAPVDVFVTVNAMGFKGIVQHVANLARLERLVHLDVDAFDDDEILRIDEWVRQGGRALIVADHAPAGLASTKLAARFGVRLTNWWAEDDAHHDAVSQNPGALLFSRENDLLADHPINNGRDASETVNRVMTFTGQALAPPPHGEALLRLSRSAREYPFRASREREGRPAAGLAQAVALRHGRGRVVIMGEAAALTAQLVRVAGSAPMRIGMNRDDNDNRQFALNIMHWLMGLL